MTNVFHTDFVLCRCVRTRRGHTLWPVNVSTDFTVNLSINEGRLRTCISEQQTPLPNIPLPFLPGEKQNKILIWFWLFWKRLICSCNSAVYCNTISKHFVNYIYIYIYIYIWPIFFFNLRLLVTTRISPSRYTTGYLQRLLNWSHLPIYL